MPAYSQDIGTDAAWPAEATRRMNRMYRWQRHIYDATRRYYLLGRDRLIAGLRPAAGQSVLEIGCGTGFIPTHDFSASTFRPKCWRLRQQPSHSAD
jgi:S-adenosylmethionine-diacylgycerolhomoserine-N-methlytransferase